MCSDQPALLLCSLRTAVSLAPLLHCVPRAVSQRSLRAKLTHAFDLLRAYQHKCRVLDATIQVAAAAGSRPTTPSWPGAAAGSLGLPPPLLAAQMAVLGAGDASFESMASSVCEEAESAEELDAPPAPAASPPATSRQLSPVAEEPSEGSFGADPCRSAHPYGAGRAVAGQLGCLHVLHSGPTAQAAVQAQLLPCGPMPPRAWEDGSDAGGASSVELAAPQAVLPQLETLRLMAQALLEAQANVAAKQAAAAHKQQDQQRPQAQLQVQQQDRPPLQHMQQRIPQQQSQQQLCSAASPAAGLPGTAAAQHVPSERTAPLSGGPSGPHGGSLPSAPISAHNSAACCGSCDSLGSISPAPTHDRGAGTARVPLAAVQSSQVEHQGRAHLCSALAFDADLMELVDDVEGLLQLAESSRVGSLAGGARGATTSARCVRGGRAASLPSPLYEENDLLDLIAQL